MTTLEEVRARFARDQGLPFADPLSELSIRDALKEHGGQYRDRLFSPVTTIWGFLSQALSEDHSCRDTVSRIIAHRAAAGLQVCSPNTASYCNARARLPTAVPRSLARRTAQQLEAVWHGITARPDGTSPRSALAPGTPPQPPQPPPRRRPLRAWPTVSSSAT